MIGDEIMKVSVGVSSRHVHFTKEVYEYLFGDEPLEKLRDLDQPLQFASNRVVSIKCGDRQIDNVRIVGPLRDYNQVEISLSDAYRLKVNPPIRTSGDLEGSLPVTVIGPCGSFDLDKGLILANRHIHMTFDDLKKYGFEVSSKVCVKALGEKAGIIMNVHLKVQEESNMRLHLDTDDANALGLKNGDEVEILRIK